MQARDGGGRAPLPGGVSTRPLAICGRFPFHIAVLLADPSCPVAGDASCASAPPLVLDTAPTRSRAPRPHSPLAHPHPAVHRADPFAARPACDPIDASHKRTPPDYGACRAAPFACNRSLQFAGPIAARSPH